MERKAAQGYTYGPDRIDEPAESRRHPDMVDYDDLDEETKEKDRAPIRQFPESFGKRALWRAAPEPPSSDRGWPRPRNPQGNVGSRRSNADPTPQL